MDHTCRICCGMFDDTYGVTCVVYGYGLWNVNPSFFFSPWMLLSHIRVAKFNVGQYSSQSVQFFHEFNEVFLTVIAFILIIFLKPFDQFFLQFLSVFGLLFSQLFFVIIFFYSRNQRFTFLFYRTPCLATSQVTLCCFKNIVALRSDIKVVFK